MSNEMLDRDLIYRMPEKIAKAALILMAISVCALLFAVIFPENAVNMLAPQLQAVEAHTVPVSCLMYIALYAAMIISSAMTVNHKGKYAPFVIAVAAASISQLLFLPTLIETIYTARFKGEAALVALSALRSFSNIVSYVSQAGIILCIASSSAYAFLKQAEAAKSVRQPSGSAGTAVAVISAVYIFCAAGTVFIGKNLIYGDIDRFENVGFYIPVGFLVNIAAAFLLSAFTISKMHRAAIVVSILYPAAAFAASYAESMHFSAAGDIDMLLYCNSIYSLNQYIVLLLGISAIVAAAAAGRELCLKGIREQDEIFSV